MIDYATHPNQAIVDRAYCRDHCNTWLGTWCGTTYAPDSRKGKCLYSDPVIDEEARFIQDLIEGR